MDLSSIQVVALANISESKFKKKIGLHFGKQRIEYGLSPVVIRHLLQYVQYPAHLTFVEPVM